MTDKKFEVCEKRALEIIAQYPHKHSAVMPLLYLVQEQVGCITEEGILWVSEKIDMPPVHVREVATFYTMYYKKPVGRFHFQVCRTLSCALRGAKDITGYLKERFGLAPGEVSPNGLWSYEEVECLGSCGTAPMCQINDTFFENLSTEKLGRIIDRIEMKKPNLRLSTLKDEMGEGLQGNPKSEVI